MYYSTTAGLTSMEGFTAHITRNRNRSRIYEDTVYFKNGENFEIELFNPSTAKALAKIKINGNNISKGGIILRPGERVYLERFIETNNKFLFETYEVDKSEESINAIRDNGLVEIDFYTEQVFGNPYGLQITPQTWTYINQSPVIGSINLTGSTPPFGGTTVNNLYTTTTSSPNARSASLETGRVEMGESSNQKFKDSFGSNFNSFPAKSIKYRIIPESQKPMDSGSIRNYCTNCGTRMKKQTWKFCPNCGSKI